MHVCEMNYTVIAVNGYAGVYTTIENKYDIQVL